MTWHGPCFDCGEAQADQSAIERPYKFSGAVTRLVRLLANEQVSHDHGIILGTVIKALAVNGT